MGRSECRRRNRGAMTDYHAATLLAGMLGTVPTNHAVTALLFTAIQALVGAAVKLLGATAIGGPLGKAEGGGQGNVLAAITHWLATQLRTQVFHQGFGAAAIGVAQQQPKLFTPQATQRIGGPQPMAEAVADVPQRLIASIVAVLVIHRLEIVDIQYHQHQLGLAAFRLADALLDRK